jgi:thiamine-phosphate pyrophosphorylase
MADRCLLYYITDRTTFAADEPTRRHRLLEKIAEAARAGVDYIQLREKDLPTRELESLSREAVDVLRQLRTENRELRTALLINSRIDVALASGADGVHLRSDDISPQEAKKIWEKCGAGVPGRISSPQAPMIGVSCHSPGEVRQAEAGGATFAVFAPVFEKQNVSNAQPAGLTQLREACKAKIPVLALGGVSLENAKSCLEAGASGIAAIRLFQDNRISEAVAKLRRMTL